MLLRVCRISTAARPLPRTNAGITMRARLAAGFSHQGTNPEAGSQPRRTDSSRISMIPSQKLGMESPQSETPLARRSHAVFRRSAENTPAGMAMAIAIKRERHASSMVIGSFFATVFTTGSRVRIDSPRSPRTARRAQRRYCTGMGSRRPYFSRISSSPAASASVPAMTRAGSPGIMRTPVNTIMLITHSVTAEMTRRWIRKSSTVARPAGSAGRGAPEARAASGGYSVPGRALDADQAVGHRLVALQVLRERRDVVQVVEVDDVAPLADELVDGVLVERGALRLIGHLASPVERRVDGLVAGQGRVEAAAAGVELVDVGVGIHAAAPADQEGLQLPRVVLGERRGELGRPQRDVEPGLLRHPLDHLGDAAVLGVVDDRHLEALAAAEAGVGQELLRARHVAHGTLPALVEERAHRRDRRAARRVLPVPRHLVQRLAVDGEVEGLAHARVVRERRAEVSRRLRLARLVVEVDGDPRVADARDARHLETPFLLEAHRVGGRHQVHEVDVARAQIREPHVVVGDDAEHEPVEVRLAGIEVVRRLLQHDAVLGHALDEAPGPHAHRRGAELLPELVRLGW